MHSRVNPFYHSGPVTGEGFVGRKELRWLGTRPPTCTALYGPERIGKSSILLQLCRLEGPQKYPNYSWAYLDTQGIRSSSEFWKVLAEQLGAPGQDIRAALDRVPAPTILCLDEFGKTLSWPDLTADFYDFLHSLARTGKLVPVISTLRPLKDLRIPGSTGTSPFFDIFRPLPLGPLSSEAAQALLKSRGLGDDSVEWILANVREHNHPYHLQLLGAFLWETERSGQIRREEARARALEYYQQALEWENSPDNSSGHRYGHPASVPAGGFRTPARRNSCPVRRAGNPGHPIQQGTETSCPPTSR